MKHMKRKRALWFMCLLLCAGTLLAQEYRMDKTISYRPDSKDEYVQ